MSKIRFSPAPKELYLAITKQKWKFGENYAITIEMFFYLDFFLAYISTITKKVL